MDDGSKGDDTEEHAHDQELEEGLLLPPEPDSGDESEGENYIV